MVIWFNSIWYNSMRLYEKKKMENFNKSKKKILLKILIKFL